MTQKFNLAFFCRPGDPTLRDLRKVAKLVAATHPDIHAVALSTRQRLGGIATLLGLAAHPTLSVELARPQILPILRGERLKQLRGAHRGRGFRTGGRTSKIDEMLKLEAAGLPVPKWIELRPDTKLDPEEWGPYVVIKPSVGGRGYNVVIRKTARVRFKAPEEHDSDSLGRLGPSIIQEFIYTGRRPESIRVLTFLGRPVGALRYYGHSQANELHERFGFKTIGGYDIVAFDKGGKVDFAHDPEALDLARRAHQIFPEIPVLGVDVIRDLDTGKYYVLETNPEGPHWTLATPGIGLSFAPDSDSYAQFDALRVIAEASAEAVYRLAR